MNDNKPTATNYGYPAMDGIPEEYHQRVNGIIGEVIDAMLANVTVHKTSIQLGDDDTRWQINIPIEDE